MGSKDVTANAQPAYVASICLCVCVRVVGDFRGTARAHTHAQTHNYRICYTHSCLSSAARTLYSEILQRSQVLSKHFPELTVMLTPLYS